MFENPGDELYFGEVYRQVLQEPWLPGGGDVWEVIGKSRRGRRPSQMGITGPNISPTQEEVRRWFSKCAAAWRDLPWELPPDPFCDNRNDRRYWKDEKDRRGLMCSYYDHYMRYCLRFALNTGCIPPANYLLKVKGNLSAVECNKVYDLDFPNKCGDVSMVSGDGQFVAPNEWVSPKCATEGDLCFKDGNGSFGSISYKFTPLHWCTGFIWPDYNPTEIDPNVSKPIYVEGGVPPYTWSISGSGFSFSNPVTQDPVNSLHAGPGACGTAFINVIDICGNECSGFVLCTAGQWICKSTGVCVLSGVGSEIGSGGPPSWFDYELISGYQKQNQRTVWTATANYSGPCPAGDGCLAYCSGPECVDCVGSGAHPVPCEDDPTEALPLRIHCWKAINLSYHEWEC